MKKLIQALAVLSLAPSVAGCSSSTASSSAKEGSDTLTGTYSVEITGFDWGAGTTKAVVEFDYPVDSVDKDTFTVTETKSATDFTSPTFDIVEATLDRTVTDAYLCDAEGNKVDGASKYVALELYVSPNDGSPINFTMSSMLNIWCDPYYLTITPAEGVTLTSGGTEVTSVTVAQEMSGRTTSADAFTTASFTAADGVSYEYATYEPAEKADTLVVWLHGVGEGGTEGTDPFITLLANKVTALASEEFQSTIGGAYVLVPQCPTFWMDATGTGANLNGGAIEADGTSFYTESLHELIESYKAECGAEKVVLAGCSNGGYMTMVMGMNYPDEYTALVPICEAVPDSAITDDQIEAIKDIPMFFIYSLDDTTVDPTLHENPTIERLQNAGASNLHVSTTEHVIDTSGEYTDENGDPYMYAGHWSWIYFDNNESMCNDCGEAVWSWIAEQVK